MLVSGCGCSLVPSPHFHFEIRIKIRTGYKARIWICAHVHGCLLSINKTGSCMYCILLPILNVLVASTGWCLPSPCVQWSSTTCLSAFFTPTSSTSGLYVYCTCMCRCGRWGWLCACEGIFEQDKYYFTLLPMVSVGSPTGWCVPSPCVQGSESTFPSAFF